MRNHPLAALDAELSTQSGFAGEPVNGLGELVGERGRVDRIEGARLEMGIDEKTGLIWKDDLRDPADRRSDHRRLAGHRFEINDAERFVDKRTAEYSSMRVKLDHIPPRHHLAYPDYSLPLCRGSGDAVRHLPRNLRCIRRPGAEHDLQVGVDRRNRVHQMHDPLLPSDPADEKEVRPFRVDAIPDQGVALLDRPIFTGIDAVMYDVDPLGLDIE